MNKILLALAILGTGAGAFHTARQSTNRLSREATVAREAWLAQTQLVAVAHSEQAGLIERIRELKQALALSRPAVESYLWSAVQTNRADPLPQHLRERLLEELGFNWRSSPDYVVVSKQTVRDLQIRAVTVSYGKQSLAVGYGKLTDVAATALALTPEERGQAEASLEQVKTDLKDWVLTRMERTEPGGDVLAQYALPNGKEMSKNISSNFFTAVSDALGRERAELILPYAQTWMRSIGLYDCDTKPRVAVTVIRDPNANGQLKVVEPRWYGRYDILFNLQKPSSSVEDFPQTFRFYFPNGWSDMAKREGFELPWEAPEK